MSPLMYAGVDHQPLLDGTNDYFDDGLDEGIIIPPDPFATTSNDAMQENSQLDEDDEGDSVNDYETSLIPCIEKLGLGIGIVVGATVQLATLAGNLVNIAIWGTEAGPYASTTFVVWCCCMSAMFFMAYVALRCLVQMSLKMVYKMEEENQDKDIIVVDVPSDNPMPSPSAFPTIGPSGNAASRVSSTNNGSIRVPKIR
ncbi:expressed unknown protein [Seminavis robusta]|uniref:Uncharacterized protein n=1 Tax=Seminavis robusta TaxID=568900 RepID=A0A9N8HZT5_9STRA|nr:expressed unknown protein [Seminavis robusta]|eukprot:Sro3112_g343990.1 n/a (199) ;mRNA; f:7504-8100